MPINIRPARQGDAARCGRIIFGAFQTLADQHGFPRDFPSVEAATGVASMLIATPGFHDFIAEDGQRIVGANFVDLRSRIGLNYRTAHPCSIRIGTAYRKTLDPRFPHTFPFRWGFSYRKSANFSALSGPVRPITEIR